METAKRARLAFSVFVTVFWGGSAGALSPIDWVGVGDANNSADTTGFGSVDRGYRIGRYEVTNGQYREFLNAVAAEGDANGLYNSSMAGTYGGIARSSAGDGGEPVRVWAERKRRFLG